MSEKKVVVVPGDGQKWFEQAIFIMRENKAAPKDAVTEAERIVNEYISGKTTRENVSEVRRVCAATSPRNDKRYQPTRHPAPIPVRGKKKRKADFVLNLMTFICCLGLTVLLAFILL
ncbi:hypothetical protein FACS189490_01400 [Clostridia bacterium]|nr:hypothetical protein FACS189490_01400 [Clostridia bacterium]